MPRPDGLTDEEGVVMDSLSAALAAFSALSHAAYDDHVFGSGIHQLKGILAQRIARRDYPDGDSWQD